jgi:hypothetical protein
MPSSQGWQAPLEQRLTRWVVQRVERVRVLQVMRIVGDDLTLFRTDEGRKEET